MTDLTLRELRWLFRLVDVTCESALSSAAVREIAVPTRDKIQRIIAERAGRPVPGPLVFAIDFPLDLAPTMNRYASMEGWQQKKVRRAVDLRIIAKLGERVGGQGSLSSMMWPNARPPTPPGFRFVQVVRRSSARVDEESVDAAGGKIPIDRLVKAGILAGDTAEHIDRAARWEKAKGGMGSLVVNVFDAAIHPRRRAL